MPELPEVETTRRGITPFLVDEIFSSVVVNQPSLRWPIPDDLESVLTGARCQTIVRRGKYLLIKTDRKTVLAHLGMSGSFRLVNPESALKPHDHVQITTRGLELRYHDPRRFGCILWADSSLSSQLLSRLGPEPFSDTFSGKWLYDLSKVRKVAVKNFIMMSEVVVGVGNIYASESLAMAGIRPSRPANRISQVRYNALAEAIKVVLARSIESGGTTLRDFVNGKGEPGYFQQALQVYGRDGCVCNSCNTRIISKVISGRNSYYCPFCQS